MIPKAFWEILVALWTKPLKNVHSGDYQALHPNKYWDNQSEAEALNTACEHIIICCRRLQE